MFKKLLLISFILLISCFRAVTPENDSGIYKSGIDTGNLEFINVYKNSENTKIYINTFYRGKYNYFMGDISGIKDGDSIDRRIFANRIIRLKSINNNEEELQKYKNLASSGTHAVKIVPYGEWSKVVMPVLEGIIKDITPNESGKAVMVSFANVDYVFYQKNNMVQVELLEDVNNKFEIVKIYSDTDIYKLLATKVGNNHKFKNNVDGDGMVILGLGDNISGLDSSYVLSDFNAKFQYYFDFSSFFHVKQAFGNTDYYVQLVFNAVIKAHIIEPLKNPVTTTQKASTFVYQFFRKTVADRNIIELNDVPPVNASAEMMNIDEFEKKLDRLVGKKKFKGSMQFLIGGIDFFNDFIEEIERSRDEIFIRLYIYSNDDYGIRISNILKAKSDVGVDVRVLTSGLANNAESMKKSGIPFDKEFKQPKSIGQYLAYESNVNLRTSADTFFILDHSKMIIMDRKTAYVGGMNIGQPYRYSWHDMMIKLKGPIVHEVNNQFTQAWASAGPTGDLGKLFTFVTNKSYLSKELREYYKIASTNRETEIRILYTKPQKKQIFNSQLLAINSAKRRILIENPYLADRTIINALIDARKRGVDVRVIVSSVNNWAIMGSNNMVVTNMLLKNGIRVYNYKGMTHIKAAIYDGWATVGSANFDNLSMKMNDEFNIAFSDPYYVKKLERELFDVDFELSEEVLKPYDVNWYDGVMSKFANRF